MTTASLVDHSEEFEVDLVQAPGEMDDQRRAVLTRDHSGHGIEMLYISIRDVHNPEPGCYGSVRLAARTPTELERI